MRILFVTQMWPGESDPDLGSFLVPIVDELEELGHEVEVVSIDHRGGSRAKYPRLCRDAVAARPPRSAPTSSSPTCSSPPAPPARWPRSPGGPRSSSWLTARTSPTSAEVRGVTAATRWVVRRSAGLICNSRWLADRLCAAIPAAAPKITIADCGIDLAAFAPARCGRRPAALGWDGEGPAFVCVGSLIERKNVVRARRRLRPAGRGRLAFVGDGPLRGELEGRDGVTVTGRIPQGEVPRWIAAADVALPAVADRAVRPGDAGGAGDGAQRRRHDASAGRRSSCRRRPGSWSTPRTSTP